MGQNALLFNEQYQPKAAYYGFYQGSKTDWRKAVDFKTKCLSEHIVPKIIGTKIHLDNIMFSRCNLFDISGKRIKIENSHRN